jgi:hypothetical protein
MSDKIEKTIVINVDTAAGVEGINKVSNSLDGLETSTTKVTSSTNLHSESLDKNRKGILENGGAMGLLSNATGGLAMDFKDAVESMDLFTTESKIGAAYQKIYALIVGESTGAMKGFKLALAATGIGLFIIGLGLLIANWDKVTDAVTGATFKTKAYAEAQADVTKSLTDVYKSLITVNEAVNEAKKGIIKKSDAVKTYNDTLGEAFGKVNTLDEVERKMIANTDNYIKSQIAKATAALFVGKAAEAAAKLASGEAVELTWYDKAKIALLGYSAVATTIAEKVIDTQKEQAKYTKLASEETIKANIAAGKLETKSTYIDPTKKSPKVEAKEIEAQKLSDIDISTAENELTLIDSTNQAKRDKDTTYKQDTLDAQSKFEAENAQLIYDSEDAKLQREIEMNDAKIKSKQDYYDAATGLVSDGQAWMEKIEAAGIGRSKATIGIQKGLALTAIGIDTAKAFSTAVPMALKAGEEAAKAAGPAAPLAGPIATGLSYAGSALMIIGNINKAKKILGAGGGGDAGGSTTAPPAPQAQFNVVGSSGTNQLAATIGKQQNQPIKAYVVGSDVTNQQSLDRARLNSATFL